MFDREIFAFGTGSQNRLKRCRFLEDKRLKKFPRAAFEEKEATVDGAEVRAIKWIDGKCLTVASTYAGAELCGTVKRWDKKQKKYVQVPCPYAITQYSLFMGGVDLLDGLVAFYRIRIRSRKFYQKLEVKKILSKISLSFCSRDHS